MNSETQKLLDDFVFGHKAQLEEKDAQIKGLEDRIVILEATLEDINKVLKGTVK